MIIVLIAIRLTTVKRMIFSSYARVAWRTYFYSKGAFKKINLKTKEMKNGAVYPRWHPSGKFVAFSSNKITQRFHAADNKRVEVTDLESSLVLYDVTKNEIMNIVLANSDKYMDTYPEWSPDGKYLYFCRADQVGATYDYKQIKYNLCRVPFDPESDYLETSNSYLMQYRSVKVWHSPEFRPMAGFL